MKDLPSYAVGTLIGVNNEMDRYRHLALVVDQEALKDWMEKEKPYLRWVPKEQELKDHILVRVIGRGVIRESSLIDMYGTKSEPHDFHFEHFEYAQLNHTSYITGPDVTSIDAFVKQGRLFESLGNSIKYLNEVELIAEYLGGNVREQEQMGVFTKQYFKMLEKLLPKKGG